MFMFLQKYFLEDFLKSGCIWIIFRESLYDLDKKTKKGMKITIFYDTLT